MSKAPFTESVRQKLLPMRGVLSIGGAWYVRQDLVAEVNKGAIDALINPPAPEPETEPEEAPADAEQSHLEGEAGPGADRPGGRRGGH